VWQIAGGFQRKLPKSVLHEDLVAAGMSGLWDAIRRQSAQDDERFEWYVRVRIRGAILDELRAQDWLPRRARATAEAEGNAAPAVVRLDDVCELEHAWALASGDATDNAVDAKLQSESLLRAVRQLPERERHIVASYYFDGIRFKDLSAELGVSEPRISQIHSRAMQRLRGIVDAA
jgi:RNA polymerase sigma factor for flagellar operon FliA